jgi:glucose-6-phosphate 1-dehydrogenase
MEQKQSDVLVLFGATGDLASKKIFPALQAMVQSYRLECRSSAWPEKAGPWSSCGHAPEKASRSTAVV